MVVARTQTIDSRAFTAEKPPRPTGYSDHRGSLSARGSLSYRPFTALTAETPPALQTANEPPLQIRPALPLPLWVPPATAPEKAAPNYSPPPLPTKTPRAYDIMEDRKMTAREKLQIELASNDRSAHGQTARVALRQRLRMCELDSAKESALQYGSTAHPLAPNYSGTRASLGWRHLPHNPVKPLGPLTPEAEAAAAARSARRPQNPDEPLAFESTQFEHSSRPVTPASGSLANATRLDTIEGGDDAASSSAQTPSSRRQRPSTLDLYRPLAIKAHDAAELYALSAAVAAAKAATLLPGEVAPDDAIGAMYPPILHGTNRFMLPPEPPNPIDAMTTEWRQEAMSVRLRRRRQAPRDPTTFDRMYRGEKPPRSPRRVRASPTPHSDDEHAVSSLMPADQCDRLWEESEQLPAMKRVTLRLKLLQAQPYLREKIFKAAVLHKERRHAAFQLDFVQKNSAAANFTSDGLELQRARREERRQEHEGRLARAAKAMRAKELLDTQLYLQHIHAQASSSTTSLTATPRPPPVPTTPRQRTSPAQQRTAAGAAGWAGSAAPLA